jgi:4,5-dihydroxyphthalate decarboxylase
VRFTAVPIFPMRAFHHGAIVYNTQTGIRTPQDLEGQRVGVNRGYTVTTGLWARGILQHQYNVDLSRITWVLSGDEHVAQYRPPSNVVAVERGRILEDLVTSGEIPAAIGVQIDAPHVQPLIPHATDAAVAALRADGLYPINHTLVVRDDVLRAHPDLAQDLVEVFAEARRLYVGPLAAAPPESLSAHDAFFRRVLDSTGDPLPCGIEPNRRMIETVIQYSVEQGILARPVTVEEVFWTGSS